MPTYTYNARDLQGNPVSGALAGLDSDDIREQLRQRDLFLTRCDEVATRKKSTIFTFRSRPHLSDMVVMSRQLATLVHAGMPLVESLFSVANQTENAVLREALNRIRAEVLAGSSLSEAMSSEPSIFSTLYVSLVRAGETGGILDETLDAAAIQFDQEAELREKVRSAFVYPILVLITTFGVVTYLLTFVVPVFARIYGQFKAPLPLMTRALIAISHFVLNEWYLFGLILSFVAVVILWYRQTPKGRQQIDRLKLRLPLFGKLYRKIAIARLTRTLSALVGAGVPILQSLAVSAQVAGNSVIVDSVLKVAQYVHEGTRIWIPLEQTGQFPSMVTRMIAAGEESGNLDEMLSQCARFYDRDIEYTVQRLTRALEPALTVVIGAIVLFVLLALYLPIFNLARVIRR